MVERHTIETRVGPLAVRVVGDGPTAVLWPYLVQFSRDPWTRPFRAPCRDRPMRWR